MAWYDRFILLGLAMWIGGGVSILVGFYGLQKNRPKFNTISINDVPLMQSNDDLGKLRPIPMPDPFSG